MPFPNFVFHINNKRFSSVRDRQLMNRLRAEVLLRSDCVIAVPLLSGELRLLFFDFLHYFGEMWQDNVANDVCVSSVNTGFYIKI